MAINHILDRVAKIAYSYKETVYNTHALAREIAFVDGCYVECGIGAGAQLMAMVLAFTGKRVYGFDSFEGIPMAGKYDDQQPGIGKITHDVNAPVIDRLKSSGITAHSIENVMENFKNFEIPTTGLTLVKGWFQNTLPVANTGPIALLRLDGDLYESTAVCLEYLYPLVSVGGVVIIDDYALPGCAKAVHDYFKGTDIDIIPVAGNGGVVYFYKK